MGISNLTGADIAAIAKLAKIDTQQVEGLITMATAYKMPKAETVFKGSVAKLDKKTKRAFTFVEEAKGSYFFVDMEFPLLKKDLQPKLKEVEKLLKKAKEQEKAGLEAYKTFIDALLDRVLKKKMVATYGNMKFSKSEDGKCYMVPVGKVQGARKASLHEVVNPLNLTSKTGHTICFLDPKEASKASAETEEETTGKEEETANAEANTDTAADKTEKTTNKTSARYKKLTGAFDKIKGKLSEWKSEKDSKKKMNTVKPLLKNVEKLLEHVNEFIAKGNISDSDESGAEDLKEKLESYKSTLSQMDSNIDKKKSDVTIKNMDVLLTDIRNKANKIKSEHGEELSGIADDLTSVLDEILA